MGPGLGFCGGARYHLGVITTPGPSLKELQKFKDAVGKLILRGDYRSALSLAREKLKTYPKDFECRFQYAKLLGDWADELPPAKRKKLKAEALVILRELVRALSGREPEDRFRISLNYYYQSEDFRGMHRFGKRFASRYGRRGHYAEALGASYLALRNQETAHPATAKRWAAKAVPAWKKYDLSKEQYYFPHYACAMALAVLGEKKAALERLQKAARLSKRTVKDPEFADVLAVIQKQ